MHRACAVEISSNVRSGTELSPFFSQVDKLVLIFCLISLLYAGVQTRLSQMSGPELALSWLSPNRWMVEDLFVCHAHGLSPVYRLAPTWCVAVRIYPPPPCPSHI